MNKSGGRQWFWLVTFCIVGILSIGRVRSGSIVAAQSSASRASTGPAFTGDELLESYRHVEVASVSDALEQLTGRRMYMSHKMQPIFPAKFAGFALTVKLAKLLWTVAAHTKALATCE